LNIDGKGPSWCDWYNLYANFSINQTGNVADDFYHRFNQHIALMKKLWAQEFQNVDRLVQSLA